MGNLGKNNQKQIHGQSKTPLNKTAIFAIIIVVCVIATSMLYFGLRPTQSPDIDSDGDGVIDVDDAFPNDATETTDTDEDGVGDNSDIFPNDSTESIDTDGDGVGNNADAFPSDASETADTDDDGVGDNADAFPSDDSEIADTDGDGVGDNADAFPNDANETVDTDGDGVGDNADEDDSPPSTSKTIVIELSKEYAPVTCANFEKYVEDGFFDGLIFHRVIDGFMIQGGAFTPDMTQKTATYAPINLEISPNLRHIDGAISMARTSDPNSATSQFFICDGPQANLDDSYAVFGQVISGMDIVREISSVSTTYDSGHSDVPVKDVIILSATLSEESGKTYVTFEVDY